MFCIDNRCTDVYFNLAAEEYLLKRKEEDFFMIWQSEPSVVIGKNQALQMEVDEDFRQMNGIRPARRFSGGGAVYHDLGNVNLTFIETDSRPDFKYYLQRVIDFLDYLGIRADADERMGIYVDNKKVSGSAQCIHKDRVMYHCTLLFSTDLVALNAVLRSRPKGDGRIPGLREARAISSVHSEVVNLSHFVDSTVSLKRFICLLFRYFLAEEESNSIYRFTAEDRHAIEAIRTDKYADEGWIFHRSALKKDLT